MARSRPRKALPSVILVAQVLGVIALGVSLYLTIEARGQSLVATSIEIGLRLPSRLQVSMALVWLSVICYAFNIVGGLYWTFRKDRRGSDAMMIASFFFMVVSFFLLNVGVYNAVGLRHFDVNRAPTMADWGLYVFHHVVRTGDVADLLEEFGINVQPIEPGSVMTRLLLVTFYAAAGFNLVAGLAKLLPARNLLQRPFQKLRWVFLALGMIVVAYRAWDQQWSVANCILWPLDNILRVLDFMDIMTVFRLKLHGIDHQLADKFVAMVYRVCVGIWVVDLVVAAAKYAYFRAVADETGYLDEIQFGEHPEVAFRALIADGDFSRNDMGKMIKLVTTRFLDLEVDTHQGKSLNWQDFSQEKRTEIHRRRQPFLDLIRHFGAKSTAKPLAFFNTVVLNLLIIRTKIRQTRDFRDPHWTDLSKSVNALVQEWKPRLIDACVSALADLERKERLLSSLEPAQTIEIDSSTTTLTSRERLHLIFDLLGEYGMDREGTARKILRTLTSQETRKAKSF